MTQRFITALFVCAAISGAPAQVASHAPTAVATAMSASKAAPAPTSNMQVTGRAVARVNGAVLTDRDLLREMLSIFPYARQHNGFPKSQEAQIRKGALQMIEFEELVYQETERRKMNIPAARLDEAVAQFRDQFGSPEAFQSYLSAECNGSEKVLRQRVRRSLLIDQFLKTEVAEKSKVTPAEAQAFYRKNPNLFKQSETFSIQTISILPPETASAAVKQAARKRAQDALHQAKATKSFNDFGLLAEKVSEDDYRVNMGDHKAVSREELPPDVVKAALTMQVGQVSDLIEVGSFYTFFRLNAHAPAGLIPFEQVQDKLRTDLEKNKYEGLRVSLDKRLRASGKVEEL